MDERWFRKSSNFIRDLQNSRRSSFEEVHENPLFMRASFNNSELIKNLYTYMMINKPQGTMPFPYSKQWFIGRTRRRQYKSTLFCHCKRRPDECSWSQFGHHCSRCPWVLQEQHWIPNPFRCRRSFCRRKGKAQVSRPWFRRWGWLNRFPKAEYKVHRRLSKSHIFRSRIGCPWSPYHDAWRQRVWKENLQKSALHKDKDVHSRGTFVIDSALPAKESQSQNDVSNKIQSSTRLGS